MESATYPQTPANSVNRLKQRGESHLCSPQSHPHHLQTTSLRKSSLTCIHLPAIYDAPFIHSLVDSTPVLHVSFVPDLANPTPIILPMIGLMGQYPGDEAWHCYLHGYVSSRLMKLGADAGTDAAGGLPVCIAATQFDGLVLSLTPNTHSYNYSSAVLQGVANIVSDAYERLWAMRLITDSVVPGRWDNTRVPPDGAELQSTRIMKVRITEASAKVRQGMPADERKDMRREDVLDRVWTGAVPVWHRFGEPVPGPYNRVDKVPDYIKEYVATSNDQGERRAAEVARKEAPPKKKKVQED